MRKILLLFISCLMTFVLYQQLNPPVELFAQGGADFSITIDSPTSDMPADAGALLTPNPITTTVMVSPTVVLTSAHFAVYIGTLTATIDRVDSLSNSYTIVTTPPTQTVAGLYNLKVWSISGTITATDMVTNAVQYHTEMMSDSLEITITDPTTASPADAGLVDAPTNINVTVALSSSATITQVEAMVKVDGMTATVLSTNVVSDMAMLSVAPPTQTMAGLYDLMVYITSGNLTATNTMPNAVSYRSTETDTLKVMITAPTSAAPANAGMIDNPTNISVMVALSSSTTITQADAMVMVGQREGFVVSTAIVSDILMVVVTPPTQTMAGLYDLMVSVTSHSLTATDTMTQAISYTDVETETVDITIVGPTTTNPAEVGQFDAPTNLIVTLNVSGTAVISQENIMVQVGGLMATVTEINSVGELLVLQTTPPTQTSEGLYDLMVSVTSGVLTATDTQTQAVSYLGPNPMLEVTILNPTTSSPANAGVISSPNNITLTLNISTNQVITQDHIEVKIGGLIASIVSMEMVEGNVVLLVTPPTQNFQGLYDLVVSVSSGNATDSAVAGSAVEYERDDNEAVTVNIVSPTTTEPANAGPFNNPNFITVTLMVTGINPVVEGGVIMHIGNITATILRIDQATISDTYIVSVDPPAQSTSGLYDLQVDVTSGNLMVMDVETEAVSYVDVTTETVMIDITSPTTAMPAEAGLFNSPTNITLTIAVSSTTAISNNTIMVTIGGLTATVVSAQQMSDTIYLTVTPPSQAAPGLYDLKVSLTAGELMAMDNQPMAVKYSGDLLSLLILGPTTIAPAYGGPASTPNKIYVVVNRVDVGLTRDAFSVTIGGLPATIVTVYEDENLQRYILEVIPPVQPSNGLYDLVVTAQTEAGVAQGSMAEAVHHSDSCNVDVSLVLDRSGSMRKYGYMEPAQAAAKQFVDFMRDGDQVSVASFATTSQIDYPLTLVSPATKLAAQTAIDSLVPVGYTSIGGGLEKGQATLATSQVMTNPSAIVLLSDGKENRPPFVADVLPEVKNNNTVVHTIGLGPESDADMLADIADQTGGMFAYTPTEANLARIYNDIARLGFCQEANQPIGSQTGVISGTDTITQIITIDDDFGEITFSIFWGYALNKIEFVLIAPDGTVIDPDVALDDDDIEYVISGGYIFYRIKGVKVVKGKWKLKIKGSVMVIPQDTFFTEVVGQIKGIALTMRLFMARHFYFVGTPIKVVVVLSEQTPVIGAQVTTVIGPILTGNYGDSDDDDDDDDSGSSSRQDPNPILQLYDDGLHGDGAANDGVYANTLAGHNTTAPGNYRFQTYAKITKNNGEVAMRQHEQIVTVSASNTNPANTVTIHAEAGQSEIYLPVIEKD